EQTTGAQALALEKSVALWQAERPSGRWSVLAPQPAAPRVKSVSGTAREPGGPAGGRRARRLAGFVPVLLIVLTTLILPAFWLLPLAADSRYATPVLRVPFRDFPNWLLGGRLPLFAAFAALAVAAASGRARSQRNLVLAMGGVAVLFLALIVLDYVI